MFHENQVTWILFSLFSISDGTKIVPDVTSTDWKDGSGGRTIFLKKYVDRIYAKVQLNDYRRKGTLSSGLPRRIDRSTQVKGKQRNRKITNVHVCCGTFFTTIGVYPLECYSGMLLAKLGASSRFSLLLEPHYPSMQNAFINLRALKSIANRSVWQLLATIHRKNSFYFTFFFFYYGQ